MTIELNKEEAKMLGEHLNQYLTLMYYDWEGTPESDYHQQFLTELAERLLSS